MVSGAPDTAQVEVNPNCFQCPTNIERQVEIAKGAVITVSLASNPSTGFSWSEQAQIASMAIVQQTGHEVVEPDADGVVGAAGSQVWTFKALEKGTTVLSMEYSQPWDGGEKAAWTFELNVTVK